MRASLRFDGAAKGNPGPAGAGALVEVAGQAPRRISRALPFEATNNVAEYFGLILGLEAAQARGATEVLAEGDSELIVKQVQGRYQVKQAHLAVLHVRATELARGFARFRIAWIPRARNGDADALAREGAEEAAGKRASLEPYRPWQRRVAEEGRA